MNCPKCGKPTHVIETKHPDDDRIRRRLECLSCGHRFNTIEQTPETLFTNKLEKEIEKKLREMVESRGGKCLKWVCPGWSGVPDRIVLLPGGKCVFVETKRPKGGTLSALQKKWKQWLTALGFYCPTVWDEEDLRFFEAFLRSWEIEREGHERTQEYLRHTKED